MSLPGDAREDVAAAIGGVYRRFYGRGPGQVRAMPAGDELVVTLDDVLTLLEKSLVDRGEEDVVRRSREVTRPVIGVDCRGVIESLTGFAVDWHESSIDVVAGIAIERFTLAQGDAPEHRVPDGGLRQEIPDLRDDVRRRARAGREEARALRAQAEQARRQSRRLHERP